MTCHNVTNLRTQAIQKGGYLQPTLVVLTQIFKCPAEISRVDNHQQKKVRKENDLSQCDKSTNRGLISEDRSTEATLLFTIPRSCLSRLHRIYL